MKFILECVVRIKFDIYVFKSNLSYNGLTCKAGFIISTDTKIHVRYCKNFASVIVVYTIDTVFLIVRYLSVNWNKTCYEYSLDAFSTSLYDWQGV
jgi:hypothetical protein